jgi:hypothetical protein
MAQHVNPIDVEKIEKAASVIGKCLKGELVAVGLPVGTGEVLSMKEKH